LSRVLSGERLEVASDRLFNRLRLRLRQPAFWYVHGMILLATAGHYGIESGDFFEHGYLHHIPVILYTIPIVYAGLRFGWEGGLLAGLWALVLTLPNMVFWHREHHAWAVELTQMSVAIAVGIVVARLVMQEDRARRKAEVLAERVQRVNRMILRGQEEERLRIARDLHDGPVQSLVYLCHQLDAVARTPSSTADGLNVAHAREAVETALSEVRRFSRDLRPSILDDLGLTAALEWLVRSTGETGSMRTVFTVSGEPHRLRPEDELALFRIAQEALRNAMRHSEATDVAVELVCSESNSVRLCISDNGIGFDPGISMAELSSRGHLGLNGIHERARLVGANLTISTMPGGGTTVEVSLGRSGRGNGRTGEDDFALQKKRTRRQKTSQPV
jgi:two-component system, NarL family, sensor histidine kinase DegS